MVRDSVPSDVGVRLTGFAANHPRLVVTLVLLLALVAAQGTVAAGSELDLTTTSGSGSVDDGP